MTRITVFLSAMLIASVGYADTFEYHELAQITQSAEARAAVARFDHAVVEQQPQFIATALTRLADNDNDALAEHLLVEGALRLAQLDASLAATAVLEQLAKRSVNIWVQHEHAGRRTPLAAFDPAAAARYALTQQQAARDASRLAASLADGAPISTRLSASAAPAMGKLTTAQLRRTLPALTQALSTDPALGAAIVQAAIPVRDVDALAAVIERGNDADAHAALRAAASFDGALDQQILDAALTRSATRSAALYQLAADVAHDPALTPQLLAWLDSPSVAMAAAAAIGRLNRSDLAARIGEQLATESSPDRANALALALTLMDNDEAQARIDAYVDSPTGLPALKTKLATRRAQVAP